MQLDKFRAYLVGFAGLLISIAIVSVLNVVAGVSVDETFRLASITFAIGNLFVIYSLHNWDEDAGDSR